MRSIFLLVFIVSGMAFADAKEFYFQRYQDLKTEIGQTPLHFGWLPEGFVREEIKTIEEKNFEQRLDHDSCCDLTTFNQRYYIDSSLASGKGAPVFLYICGESTCESRSLQGAIREHAKKYGAHLVALEHRYYGKSQPFSDLSTAHLKYLSTGYAVKDLANFVQYLQTDLGLTGKLVTFGGSYPGSLSAYFRALVPSLSVGALASSAPVRAEANFEEYDLHVSQVAGTECATALRNAVKVMDAAVGTADMKKIKAYFAAESVKDDVDFLYVVADVGASAVQYGFQKDLCAALKSPDAVKAYGDFAQVVYKKFGMDALRMSMYEGSVSENPDDYLSGFGYRAWLYQSCTEYGYWQNAYHDAGISVRSPRISQAYHNQLCDRLFGIKQGVDTSNINQNFLTPVLSASNLVMTNGTNDPWSRLSLKSRREKEVAGGPTLYMIQGAAHCDDLRSPKTTDSQSLQGARTLLQNQIAMWFSSVL